MFLTKKNESEEIQELRKKINLDSNKSLIDKLLQSKEIDKLINKIQDIYHNIAEKLFIKYDLKNELKQGKLFTIIIASLIFIYLVITTIFFVIMLNSLIGLNLIFSLVKYSLFFAKWGYTIIKNKGSVIQKYLANLFPNNKSLQPKETKRVNLPPFETIIIMEIESILNSLNSFNFDTLTEKEIILDLQSIVKDLKLEDTSFINEIKNIEFKQDICNRLNIILVKLNDIKEKENNEKKLIQTKTNLLEKLEQVENRVNNEFSDSKVKKLSKS